MDAQTGATLPSSKQAAKNFAREATVSASSLSLRTGTGKGWASGGDGNDFATTCHN